MKKVEVSDDFESISEESWILTVPLTNENCKKTFAWCFGTWHLSPEMSPRPVDQ
jgi:hypothetical protein